MEKTRPFCRPFVILSIQPEANCAGRCPMPVFYALSSSGTYLSGEEKGILILQGCAFLLLGFFWAERVRRTIAVHETRPRTSNVGVAISSELVATQLLRVSDGFSTRHFPPSESSPSLISIPYRPKQADIFAHSDSTTGLFYRSPRSGSRSPLTG